jgi:hypothetical protein
VTGTEIDVAQEPVSCTEPLLRVEDIYVDYGGSRPCVA